MTYALIFANGDLNDGAMVRRAVDAALASERRAGAKKVLLVAADGGARIAGSLDLHPHVVIGDMDSSTPDELAQHEAAGAEILRYPVEKNETDLELALMLVAERGAKWVRVIGAVGDRLDQTMSNVYLMALPQLEAVDTRMVAGKQEIRLLSKGDHTLIGVPGDTISLLPITGDARGVTTDGLYYPLLDETLAFGPARGVSNVMSAARARVRVESGTLLCVHTIGRA